MARFCTTYDAAVYSLVLALQTGEDVPPSLPCERLGMKNTKKFRRDEVGLKFARLSLISVGEKLRDDRIDGKKFKAGVANTFLSRAINKAKKAEPEIAESSFKGTEKINELQNKGATLSEVLSAYGDMAKASFSTFIELTPQTEELVRSISEYNFLVDMVVDYDDDYKSGTYNWFKREGLATFSEYYDRNYTEFTQIADAITGRLINALFAVRDDSKVWNTLFKIIMSALDTVLPSAILGEDVGFHYFDDLFARIRQNNRLKRDLKRLGLTNEEN